MIRKLNEETYSLTFIDPFDDITYEKRLDGNKDDVSKEISSLNSDGFREIDVKTITEDFDYKELYGDINNDEDLLNAFESIITSNGFEIESKEFYEDIWKSCHYQIINKSHCFIDEIDNPDLLREPEASAIIEPLLGEVHEFSDEHERNVITYSIGLNRDGFITGGLDVRRLDSIKEECITESVLQDLENARDGFIKEYGQDSYDKVVDYCDKNDISIDKFYYNPETFDNVLSAIKDVETECVKKEVNESKTLKEADHYDENALIRAWVGNVGKYSEGQLVGTWISFPIDEDELQKILHDEVLIGTSDGYGNTYEDYGLFDWESDYIRYPGEYGTPVETINEWAKILEGLDDSERHEYLTAEYAGLCDDIREFNPDDYLYLQNVNDSEDLGHYLVGEVGGVENLDKDTIKSYLDYEKLGSSLEYDSHEDGDGNEVSASMYWCGDENASDYEIGQAYVDSVGVDGVSDIDEYFDYEAYAEYDANDGFFTEYGFIIEK